MKKLIVITGPTGAGKTSLSIKTALHLKNAEIISADSKQIYKEMDIGTDKIEDKKGIPHHLIDLITPKETFTVFQYKKLAREKISEIQNKGKIPILCGGSYFYIKATVEGLVLPQAAPDWKFRKNKRKESVESLFNQLKEKDPGRAKSIDKENKRRLIRALEIIKKTNKPVPPLKKDPLPYPVLMLGVKMEEKKLEERINNRVDLMVKKGLKEEAKNLLEKYEKVPGETIGYKEWEDFFKGKITEKEAIKRIKIHTRQFSKKQTGWLEKEDIVWVKNFPQAKAKIKKYLKK